MFGAVGLLVAGILLTAFLALTIKRNVETVARRELDFTSNEIRRTIAERLADSAQALLACAGLFDASDTVTRDEWRTFTQRLKLDQRLPGIQGTGFAQLIPRGSLARHVQDMRGSGFPTFKVWPEGERATYSTIVYLEPFSGRNLRALGFDMFTESVRRRAMERARDENEPALSGKVTLVQETGQDLQAGTLMYVPVYRRGSLIDTPERRQAAILGWVYSPYRMGDLMRGTLESWELKLTDRPLFLRIYDGDSTSADNLLYDSRGGDVDSAMSAQGELIQKIPMDFAGRRWTLLFTQRGELVSGPALLSIVVFFTTGTIISLLTFFLVLSWLGTREKALRIADQLTGEMREILWRMDSIIEGTRMGTWEWNVQTGETVFNEQWANLLGYTLDELAPVSIATWERLAFPDDLKKSNELLERHFAGELPYYDLESRMMHKDGRLVWIHDRGRVFTRDGDDKPLMMFGTHADITDRRNAEAALLQSSEENRNLLGELQHRVKNSFAMISSMMGIASGSDASPETKATLEELDSRVRSVSELYSLLYSSGSYTELRFDNYCAKVVAPLVGLNDNITLSLNLESLMVTAKKAAPIGLILTELMTNAVKYAFPEHRRGTIFISLKRTDAGAVLEVRDDGIGLPEGFVAGSAGIGLMLVKALVKQIDGAFAMEGNADGTRCVLEFPLP